VKALAISPADLALPTGIGAPARAAAGFSREEETVMATLKRIVPCLWFDGRIEEAAKFYTAIFPNSRILSTSRYSKSGQEVHGHQPGEILTVTFSLDGSPITALNGGPQFKFSEAISLQVMCETQAEIDHYWEKLSEGGDANAQQCGWLKDKFGVSWQVVPVQLPELLGDADPVKTDRTLAALMKMKKLNIAQLQKAHDGG
jgi:predicted 3-demethylubiquinone-9 3-methyltransferase (glyoxalase superfamily)